MTLTRSAYILKGPLHICWLTYSLADVNCAVGVLGSGERAVNQSDTPMELRASKGGSAGGDR